MKLSVLDQSPIPAGGTAADAVRNTIDLAEAAERFGYHRYWLAEHHASPALAGVAPEALIGPVALATSRIRIGSGGIMLPHFSPFKVAETFRLLSAMGPGRIDLGLGRAPGSDQRTAYALQRDRSKRMLVNDFPEQVAELLGYLEGSLPDDHLFKPLEATLPSGGSGSPDVWMLGSSSDSAVWAGQMGLPYCIADFINSDALPLADLYRQHFTPSARCPEPYLMVAVWAIAAEDRAGAERLAAPAKMMFAHLVRGSLIPVPSMAVADAWLADNPQPPARRRTLLGTGAEVADEVREVARLYGAQEMMLVNILPEHAPRVRSYQLVAEALHSPPFVSSEVEKRT
ncbi:LLM class flavin-dependent oxidoreductase [Sphingomonas sp. ID1715]|uniref:LLM class flavin-dependent oxidoreductase n=1 Tax=Sphingomonas sp. ID1715 TaxID=1656898 RepID=UPI0014894F7F|nr:LLM class flavin-dependent oxidoreductase [Sphingomonas sp. ID1715]